MVYIISLNKLKYKLIKSKCYDKNNNKEIVIIVYSQ